MRCCLSSGPHINIFEKLPRCLLIASPPLLANQDQVPQLLSGMTFRQLLIKFPSEFSQEGIKAKAGWQCGKSGTRVCLLLPSQGPSAWPQLSPS
ncbi:unnamed protein product, partial [Gulo gulo]